MKDAALLILTLALAAPAFAAGEGHAVNSVRSEGDSIMPTTHRYANTGADAATARDKGNHPEAGYAAAGVGVAMLSGLLIDRLRRNRR